MAERIAGLLLLLLLGLLAGLGAMTAWTAWLLSRPPRRTYAAAVARGRPGDPGELKLPLEFREWRFVSRGRRFPAWEVRGGRPGAPTLIISHGWGDSRVVMLGRIAALAPLFSRVIVWDLPGHGDAPDRCRLGTREAEDLAALVDAAMRRDEALVLYGFSLGAGVSIVAAAQMKDRPLSGVIAEAPYRVPRTPARNVLKQLGLPWRWNLPPALRLLGVRERGFDRADWASRVRAPLLVLHGARDAISPLEDGEAIARAAPMGRLVVAPEGEHLNLWTEPTLAEASLGAVREFVEGECAAAMGGGTVTSRA